MPDPTLLDDNGNPIQQQGGLLDDNGNPIGSSNDTLMAPKPGTSGVGEFVGGAKDVGKGFLSLFNPFEKDPDSPLGYSTPPERMAKGMVKTATRGAQDLSEGLSQVGSFAGSTLDALRNRINMGQFAPPPDTKQIDTLSEGGSNIARAGLAVPELSGLPTTEAYDLAKEGKGARAAGMMVAGSALAYGLGRAHAPEAGKVLDTPDTITPKPEVPVGPKSTFDAKTGAYILPDKGTTTTPEKSIFTDKDTTKPLYTATQKYDINFANDVDKSMWIVSTSTPGPKYSKALNHIVDQTGVSPERAVELSKEFNNYVKLEMKGKESGAHDMPAVYGAGMEDAQAHSIPPENSIKLYRGGYLELPKNNEDNLDYRHFTPDIEHAEYFARSRNEPLSELNLTPEEFAKYKNTEFQDIDFKNKPAIGEPFKSGPLAYQIPANIAKQAKNLGYNPLDNLINEVKNTSEYQNDPYKERHLVVKLDEAGVLPEVINKLRKTGRLADNYIETPQEMRVPGINPETGRENIAMGGASPNAYKGFQSMYQGDRTAVITKELLQNAIDEQKQLRDQGIETKPIKVLKGEEDINPQTGQKASSLTVRDYGRGLTPDQLYTIFTDLGESGKRTIDSASGGFGFAKAAFATLGRFARMESVVKEGNQNVKYVFEGNPKELINQAAGVPLRGEPTSEPTGMRIKVYFDEGKGYPVGAITQGIGEHSFDLPVEIHRDFPAGSLKGSKEEAWINDEAPDYKPYNIYQPKPAPPRRLTIDTPEATVHLHWPDVANPEEAQRGADLHLLNKGLYQSTRQVGYDINGIKDVPPEIYADIVSKVEEGEEGYPYTTNREDLNSGLKRKIQEAVTKDIVGEKIKEQQARLQALYDGIGKLFKTSYGEDAHFIDEGNRFTPEELDKFKNSPKLQEIWDTIVGHHNDILNVADKLKGFKNNYGVDPSVKLEKFGIIFKGADERGNQNLGVHIPNVADQNKSAIMINLMAHLQDGLKERPNNPADLVSSALFQTIAHEDAHIPGGGHDTAHSYRNADLLSKLGTEHTIQILQDLKNVLGDKNGQYHPEIQKLLSLYEESRLRPSSSTNDLLKDATPLDRPPNPPNGKGPGNEGTGSNSGGTPRGKPSFKRELFELSRGTTAAMDISAPFNQGFGMIGTREWFKAWKPMIQAFGSEGAFEKTQSQLERLPVVEDGIAHESGLALMDLSANKTRNEEFLQSRLAEKIPGIRASNRAYTAYLNSLRANSLQRLYDAMPPELQKEPYHVKELASFINDATGRGRHEYGLSKGNLQNIPVIGKMMPDKEVGATLNLERYSKALNDIYFAPRKTSATVRMLNPGTYITLPPMIRNQYLKSLLRMGVAYTAINTLMQGLGGETTSDPTNSDFGKFKFGNGFRVNTPGGFGPFLVLAARIASGRMTSSDSGRTKELGKGFKAWTVKDLAEQFGSNKLHPTWRMAYDLADASGYKPYSVFDRTLQTYIPMAAQDLISIVKNDPSLLPGMIPSVTGMGTQYYEKGMNKNLIVPPEDDIQIKGSPFRALYDKMNGGN